MVWALLPLKDLVKAKSRLSGILSASERRALAQAMVEDVLEALTHCPQLEGILLVSDDPAADLLAHKYGVSLVSESSLGQRGLNQVVAAGCAWLRERGIDSVMIVHSDLPLLSPEDINSLLGHFSRPGADAVLSPDQREYGTNIQLVTSGRSRFQYGPNSCKAHREALAADGLEALVVSLPGVALDVDEPADLLQLWHRLQRGAGERSTAARHTAEFLLTPELEQRLALIEHSTRGDQPTRHYFDAGK